MTLIDLDSTAIVGMYGRKHEQDFGPRYNPFKIKYIETDANFWKIHHFNFIDGKPFSEGEVNNKEQVAIISSKMAVQLLGDTRVAGKFFEDGEQRTFRIAGVIEDVNPHFEVAADLYLPYTVSIWDEDSYISEDGVDYYYNRGAFKGVILAHKKSDFKYLKKRFNTIIDRINKTGQVEEFDHVNASLRSPAQQITSMMGLSGDDTDSLISVLMAFIFLLLPIIILSNINRYSMLDRFEEIGIRKSFGARRRDIIRQFFIENVFITSIGCIIAIFLGYFLNRLLAFILYRTTEIPGFEFNVSLILYLFAGTLLFGLLTVILPVIKISRVQPVLAINQNTSSGHMQIRIKSQKKWLQVLTYFVLSLVLILCGILITQANDSVSGLGYETKNVLMIMVDEAGQNEYDDKYNSERFEGYRESLLRIGGVEKVSYVLESPPFYIVPQEQEYFMINEETTNIRTLETDSEFFDLLGIKAIKGEVYSSGKIQGNYLPAVATIAGEKEFFNGDALGKVIKRKSDGQNIKIIGVIEKYKNYPRASLSGIMVCRNRPSRTVLVKYKHGTDLIEMQNQINKLTTSWKGASMSFSENESLETEEQKAMKLIYSIYYGVTLALSFLFLNAFLGYFTLVYYNVQTRKKEMGVRRATGANKGHILRKILAENLIIMLIGSLTALALLWQFFTITNFDKWQFFWKGYWLSLAISLIITLGSAIIPAIMGSLVKPVEALAEE
jgi:putative ABC transport system permease protein